MIERRNIAVCIVLTLVTCGIYGIYWIVCLTNDVNTVSGDVNGTSDRKSTRLNSSHMPKSRMPSSA